MADKEPNSEQKKVKINNDCIFSKENVNMGHQSEIDYLKCILVFLMGVSHVYSYFTIGNFGTLIYTLSLLTGACGCMLLMGIAMKYSRHHELKDYIARGKVLSKSHCLVVNWRKNFYFKSTPFFANRYTYFCWTCFFVFSSTEKNEIFRYIYCDYWSYYE